MPNLYIQSGQSGLGAQLVAGARREQAGIGDQVAVRPGAPVQQQAGVSTRTCSNPASPALGSTASTTCSISERADLHQIAVRRLPREILLAVFRQTLGIDETLLQLQRLPIGLMDDEVVKGGRPDPQSRGAPPPSRRRPGVAGGSPGRCTGCPARRSRRLCCESPGAATRYACPPRSCRRRRCAPASPRPPAHAAPCSPSSGSRRTARTGRPRSGSCPRLVVAFADPVQDVLLDLKVGAGPPGGASATAVGRTHVRPGAIDVRDLVRAADAEIGSCSRPSLMP